MIIKLKLKKIPMYAKENKDSHNIEILRSLRFLRMTDNGTAPSLFVRGQNFLKNVVSLEIRERVKGKEILRSLRFLRMTKSVNHFLTSLPTNLLTFKPAFTLAEGATHVAMPPVFSKAGFTLAETLITLGIIGVVAAMTIPTLINNTRSQQYRSQFKKTISTLSQAARLSQSQYGFDYAGINQPCGQDGSSEHPDNVMTVCSLLNGTLTGATFQKITDLKIRKNGKVVKYTVEKGEFLNRGAYMLESGFAYILSDGTIVAINSRMGKFPCDLKIATEVIDTNPTGVGLSECFGFIDVNGTNLPNKEVSCSSGSNNLQNNDCIVKNDAKHMTDIYPVRFHNGSVVPGSAAARYVLKTAK